MSIEWDRILETATKCGIRVKEFWTMTLKEIFLEIEGHSWRFEQEMSMKAHFTAWAVNPHTKKTIKATDIYNPNPPKPISLEERRKSFQQSVDLMGPDAIPVRKRA